MYSFEELERKCKRYRLKRWLMPLVILALLYGSGAYLWLQSQKPKPPHMAVQQAKSSESVSFSISSSTVSSVAVVQKPMPKPAKRCYGLQLIYVHENYMQKLFEKKQEVQKLGLSCHINYGKRLPNNQRQVFLVCETRKSKKDLQPIIATLQRHGIEYAIVRDSCKYLAKKSKATPQKPAKPQIKSSTKSSDNIIKTKKMTIEQLQKLFILRKSYDLAIKIAQAFYDKGAYTKALEWAKRANKLDRQKEEAWILYAKTLYKLGKKQKAKQLLKVFLDYKDSQEAKQLLKKWQ